MADRDPFRVMCNIWGVEVAVEKAKEFGIQISQEEIDTQRQNDKKSLDAIRNLLNDTDKMRRLGSAVTGKHKEGR